MNKSNWLYIFILMDYKNPVHMEREFLIIT